MTLLDATLTERSSVPSSSVVAQTSLSPGRSAQQGQSADAATIAMHAFKDFNFH